MTRHFGVLIPSTNTTVETECRLLPPFYQAHVGRLMTSAPGQTFSPPRDDDLDYQSRLLGTAKVEMVILAQTSASVFADDYDEVTTRRMSEGAGAPAVTSAQAIGRAVRALGARRIGLVSPYSEAVNRRAADLFQRKHGLETVALEGFGATRFLRDRQSRPGARARRLPPHRPAGDRGPRRPRRQLSDDGLNRRMGARVRQARRHHQPGVVLGDAGHAEDRRQGARLRPPAQRGAGRLEPDPKDCTAQLSAAADRFGTHSRHSASVAGTALDAPQPTFGPAEAAASGCSGYSRIARPAIPPTRKWTVRDRRREAAGRAHVALAPS